MNEKTDVLTLRLEANIARIKQEFGDQTVTPMQITYPR